MRKVFCDGCGEEFRLKQTRKGEPTCNYCIDCFRKYVRLCKSCGRVYTKNYPHYHNHKCDKCLEK